MHFVSPEIRGIVRPIASRYAHPILDASRSPVVRTMCVSFTLALVEALSRGRRSRLLCLQRTRSHDVDAAPERIVS